MRLVAIILDDVALERSPEKKFEDRCVRQPGPKEAVGTNGAILSTCHSPHHAFQPWVPTTLKEEFQNHHWEKRTQ